MSLKAIALVGCGVSSMHSRRACCYVGGTYEARVLHVLAL